MSPRRTVGLGVCGLGRIGRRHAENLAERVPGARLARVHDAAAHVARAVGEELGVPWTDDVDALLADPEVEGVVICSPTDTHAAMVARTAAAGRAVFCEKPLAPTVDEARRAVATARQAGVPLQMGFQMRFDPDLVELRARAGAVAPVRLLRASLRDRQAPSLAYLRASPGFLHDAAVHLLDLARWLMGEVEEVSAFAAEPLDPDVIAADDVDTTVCVLRFAGGELGVLDDARVSGYGFESGVELSGFGGALRVDGGRRSDVVALDGRGRASENAQGFLERWRAAYERELGAFADCIRDGTAPVVDGEDGVAAAVLCDAALLSLREGRSVRIDEVAGPGDVAARPARAAGPGSAGNG